MGSRCASWCLLGAAIAFARAAIAEDIGREPLLPSQRGGQAGPTPGAADGSAPDGAGGAQLLSARGPALSAGPSGSADGLADHAGTPQRRWYGWQTLLVDAVPLLGLAVTAGQPNSDERDQLMIAFSAAYFVGGPIVHLAHSQLGKAALSLGIRSAGPLLIVAGNQGSLDHSSGGDFLVVVGALAIPAAIAIDAAAISREDVVRDESASLVQRIGIAPWFDPKRGLAGLSVGLSL